jgi:hypothetical protein
VRKKGIALKDGVASPLVGRKPRDVAAIYAYDSRVGLLETGDYSQKRSLTAAGGTEERKKLSLLNL